MKIKVLREKLLNQFQFAAAIAPTRSPKPILQNVKLDCSSSNTVITATDLDVSVRMKVEGVEIEKPGQAIFSVVRFGAVLRESIDEMLTIEVDKQHSTIRGQRSQFKLGSENPEEFPEVNGFEQTDFFKMESRALKQLLHRTSFACDVESSRYTLGGVLLEFQDGKLVAVATDSRRLAKMEAPCEKVGNPKLGEMTTVIPVRSIQLLERFLPDDETSVEFASRTTDFAVRIPQGDFTTRLLEGRFPKWRDVFPKARAGVKIELPVGPTNRAVRQASIVANEDSRGVELRFCNGTLELSGATAEIGETKVELPISYSGEEVVISLDHRYLSDFFRVLDPDKNFTFDIENSDNAALLHTDDGYGYVVMPMARDRR